MDTIRRKFYPIVIGLCMISFLIIRLTDSELILKNGIERADEKFEAVENFGKALMLLPGQIKFVDPGLLMKFIVPGKSPFYDPLYCLLFAIICGLIIYAFFGDEEEGHFFTKKVVRAMRIAMITLFIFLIINYVRDRWLASYIKELTANKYVYKYDSFFTRVEFWLFVILARLVVIFKRGHDIQEEQDLTI